MDFPRPKRARTRNPLLWGGVAAALLLTTWGLTRLPAASPEIERSTLLIDTAQRGPMLRQVHGNGTLAPENQRFVSALTAGRVERVLARPGARVDAATVLVELSNPDVQLQALDAERQLKLAQAEVASVRATLETARLAQESALAASHSALREAERGVAVAERLARDGLNSAMDTERAKDALAEAQQRYEADQRRMEVATDALRAQIGLREADVERLRAIARFQRERVQSMRVCAGAAGVVQELALEPGQWVQSGQLLARVASPERLKAVLQVPETQARDVTPGLATTVDTRNGVVAGHVVRVDPGAQNGTVTVDVAFDGALPRGTRPDLSVDGTIEIERIPDVVSIGRPANVSAQGDARLFKLTPDGRAAVRVAVRLGRSSFNSVEVLAGIAPGERVILSDMSQWDHVDRVRLR
jgi:HlyD family secretion protein